MTNEEACDTIEKVGKIYKAGKIYYVCDRRKCNLCSSLCRFTDDINHAKNFEKDEIGNFAEV